MVNIYAPTASDDLSAVELELYHLIMTYRAQNGLGAIPLSKALTTTAGRHAIDTYENFWVAGKTYAPGANMHSWSDAPYLANHSNASVMWDAPERLGTGYTSDGFEISANGYADVTAALNGWKISTGHNSVILNQGQWANFNWTSIGIGVEQGPAGRIYHVWFGNAVDPTGVPRILGGTGVDTLTGTAFRDDLYGLGNNDVIRGGAGNDSIDGGDGTDVAVYSGAFANYQITQSGATFTVVDLRGGSPDGTDTLKNIETLRFSDGDRSLIVTPTAPEIAVSGNGVNIVDGDTTPAAGDLTDFGSVTQGGAAIQRTFTVTNTGNATLTTSGLVLPTGFTLVEGLSASIAAGGSDTFTVRMDTASAGAKSGQISFTTNDADESPFNFSISGTVNAPTAPEIAVSGNGVNIVDGDTTPAAGDLTAFGSVTQGGAAIQRTFTVTNTGNATLTTSGLVLPTGFTLVEGLSASIAAGGSDTFTVRMDTASVGAKSGQISFTTNDADESPFNFSISGTVTAPTAPEIAVSGNGVNIVDGDTTPAAGDLTAFGSVTQGGAAILRTFTVTNTGNATLTTSGLVLPTGFTLVEGLSASIAAGGSDTFTVRMETASVGAKSGQISFTTNDADESPFNFSISGTVNAPPVAGDDFADNLSDTTAPLGLLAINTPRAGSIETGADADLFRVDLVAGQTYTFSLQGLDSGRGTLYDPYLRLYSSTGQMLSADDDTGVGRESQIVYTAKATGIFYLQAIAYASDQTGTYVISANGAPVRTGDANANTFLAEAHAEIFSGLDGSDTVSYAGATAGVVASLLSSAKNTGFAFNDVYTSIENLRGSNFADTLTGNTGNNILEGGLGGDKLDGGAGIDTASYANAAAGVTADLLKFTNNSGEAAGDTYKAIENLLGSGFGDTLTGNVAVNAISGGSGMDLITGNGGGDILTGGSASDMFRFLTPKDGGPTGDIITDFVSGLDVIGITRSGFKISSAVWYGTGDANDFAEHYFVSGAGVATALNPSGVAATETGHGQFLFNQATDQLWWDQDGAGKAKAVLLATMSNGAHVTADDFWLL